MSNFTLRAILATSVASLGLNATIAYKLLVSHTSIATPDGAATPGARTERRPGSSAPFQTAYEYLDRATGKRMEGTFINDGPKLEQFIREARLSRAQELELRGRFQLRNEELGTMAQEMVRNGHWEGQRFGAAQKKYWGEEFERLPPIQRADLSPTLVPALEAPMAAPR